MSKFRKGPWRVTDNFADPGQKYVPRFIIQNEHEGICSIGFLAAGYCNSEGDALARKSEAEATAKLIAAAPKMLEALKVAEPLLEYFKEDSEESDTLNMVRAAINLATN